MTCKHLRRKIKDSRPRVIGGMLSTRRRSVCFDCGHQWTSYELEGGQLRDLVRRERSDIISKLTELLAETTADRRCVRELPWLDEDPEAA